MPGAVRRIFTAAATGLGLGAAGGFGGLAYLASSTSLVNLANDDPWFRSRTYKKYNPKGNPTLQDDCIKRVPLSQIKPELRGDEKALTLAFCRGIWSRWAYWPQSKFHERYDAPPGSESYAWTLSELALSKFEVGTKFSNHFEIVDNSGNEITVRVGGSPLQPGLRASDGLVLISANIDKATQEVVLSLKSSLFDSAGDYAPGAPHPVPKNITFYHRWYVRMLVLAGYGNVKA